MQGNKVVTLLHEHPSIVDEAVKRRTITWDTPAVSAATAAAVAVATNLKKIHSSLASKSVPGKHEENNTRCVDTYLPSVDSASLTITPGRLSR